MNRIALLLPLISLVLACTKVDAVGNAADDGAELAKEFSKQVDTLSRRAEALRRGDTVPDHTAARGLLDKTVTLLDEAHARIVRDQGKLATAAKAGNLDETLKSVEDLRHNCEHEIVAANGFLNSIDAWVANHEIVAKAPAPPPEPVDTAPQGNGTNGTSN